MRWLAGRPSDTTQPMRTHSPIIAIIIIAQTHAQRATRPRKVFLYYFNGIDLIQFKQQIHDKMHGVRFCRHRRRRYEFTVYFSIEMNETQEFRRTEICCDAVAIRFRWRRILTSTVVRATQPLFSDIDCCIPDSQHKSDVKTIEWTEECVRKTNKIMMWINTKPHAKEHALLRICCCWRSTMLCN